MAELYRKSITRTDLPPLLLPGVKTHCRVEFARDDTYLKGVIVRAIDLFERLTQWGVFGRFYVWGITAADGAASGAAWRWQLPIAPVSSVVAMNGATDVSAEYAIVAMSPDMVGDAWLVRALGEPDQMPSIELKTGYATEAEVPPGVLDFVYRASAWLYENREANLMPGADMMAYGNSLLAGQWVPRA